MQPTLSLPLTLLVPAQMHPEVCWLLALWLRTSSMGCKDVNDRTHRVKESVSILPHPHPPDFRSHNGFSVCFLLLQLNTQSFMKIYKDRRLFRWFWRLGDPEAECPHLSSSGEGLPLCSGVSRSSHRDRASMSFTLK